VVEEYVRTSREDRNFGAPAGAPKAAESNAMKARRKIARTAKAMAGAHYVNGAFGARPNGKDGAICRPGGVVLEKDVGLEKLAFFAASFTIEDRNVAAAVMQSSAVVIWCPTWTRT
jgi:hypothetical protein